MILSFIQKIEEDSPEQKLWFREEEKKPMSIKNRLRSNGGNTGGELLLQDMDQLSLAQEVSTPTP